MDFSTELIKMMPSKFRDGPDGPWTVLFQKFGEILNDVHAKIEGIADLHDRDRVPDEYMSYLSEHYGVQLTVAPGTESYDRRRMLLKSTIDLIKSKGRQQVFLDLIDFLYLVEFPDAGVSIYELWTNNYSTFSTNPWALSEFPYDWVGTGAQTSFITTVFMPPVRRRSVKITTIAADDSPLEMKDDGDGAFVGDIGAPGSIDYTTGDISIEWSQAPKAGADITVYWVVELGQYLSPHLVLAFSINVYFKMGLDEQNEIPTGWFGNGSQTDFTGTLLKRPVNPGSVRIVTTSIADELLVVTDDSLGNLVGDVGSSGTNSINYVTGDIDVSFDEAVKTGVNIVVTYNHENLFLGRERLNRLLTILNRWRPIHVVLRTEIGRPQDFWRVGDHHWRVGETGSYDVPDSERIRVGGLTWL